MKCGLAISLPSGISEFLVQTTVPYNPQQNGVAKRMNITIMNMVRSMMFFKNVKLMFWGDAVKCAAYLRNRSPSNALDNKTPHEMWFGHLL